MLQFEELRLKLQGMEPELRELKQSLNIDKLGIEIAELERKAAEPSFWDDMENSQKVLQRTAQLKASVETYNKLQSLYEDTLTLIELAEEAGDESVYEEAAADTEQLQTRMAEVRLTTLLTGEYDTGGNGVRLPFPLGHGGFAQAGILCRPGGADPPAAAHGNIVLIKALGGLLLTQQCFLADAKIVAQLLQHTGAGQRIGVLLPAGDSRFAQTGVLGGFGRGLSPGLTKGDVIFVKHRRELPAPSKKDKKNGGIFFLILERFTKFMKMYKFYLTSLNLYTTMNVRLRDVNLK